MPIHKKTIYIRFGRIFIDISGLMNSFGLAAFVVQEYVVVLQWIAAGPPGGGRHDAPSLRYLQHCASVLRDG